MNNDVILFFGPNSQYVWQLTPNGPELADLASAAEVIIGFLCDVIHDGSWWAENISRPFLFRSLHAYLTGYYLGACQSAELPPMLLTRSHIIFPNSNPFVAK